MIPMENLHQMVAGLVVQFAPRVLVATALIIAGIVVGKWAGGLAVRWLKRFQLEPPLQHLMVRTVRALVLILFAMMALQNLGVQLLPLIAGLGVAGAAVAFAMQSVLSNVAAGLMIIFLRPYRVGEYISVAGEEGQVQSIDLASTILAHTDLSRVVVPNRKIIGEILHNYGRIRLLEIVVGVGPNTDLDKALSAAEGVLRENSRCLREPNPLIAVSGFESGAISISLRPWVSVEDYMIAPGEIRKSLLASFRSRNILAPAPIYERFIEDAEGPIPAEA